MRHEYDVLWKGIMEEVCDDLLRFIFPEVNKVLDLQRGVTFLDKELAEMYPEPDKASSTRFADKLVKVFTLDGKEEWVLIHIEVQGETKAAERLLFPERMFRYYYRIFDKNKKPITAIAIFTGPDGHKMSNKYEYQFLGTSHILEGKIPELELKDRKLLVAKYLLSTNRIPKSKVNAILTFLNNIVLFEKQETNLIFMEQLDQLTGKKNTMGLIERLAERREQVALEKVKMTEEKSVRAFLENTEFPPEKIASLIDVPVAFVEEVKESLQVK